MKVFLKKDVCEQDLIDLGFVIEDDLFATAPGDKGEDDEIFIPFYKVGNDDEIPIRYNDIFYEQKHSILESTLVQEIIARGMAYIMPE